MNETPETPDRKQVVELNRRLEHADNRIATLLADRLTDRKQLERIGAALVEASSRLYLRRDWFKTVLLDEDMGFLAALAPSPGATPRRRQEPTEAGKEKP